MTEAHTPQFIGEMKQLLEREKQLLEQELAQLSHKHHGDNQADYPDYGRHPEENATEMADFEALAATTEAAEARLDTVKAALQHITDGTYGRTADGQLIPEERLRANPAASTLIDHVT